MVRYSNQTPVEVQKLAIDLAEKMANKGAIIGLTGNLGSGKTTFAKSFGRKLGIKSLKSPTFVISHQYPYKGKFLYHIDLYRLKSKKELEALDLPQIISKPNLVLIEWVDKFPAILRQCDLLINFEVKPKDKRDVTIKKNKLRRN